MMQSRPTSPHLKIYRLPIAAYISIIHRFIGCGIYLAGLFLAIYMTLLSQGWGSDLDMLARSWFGVFILTSLMIVLYFYFFAEIRYIIWGISKGFSTAFVRYSNWVILILTGLFGVALITKVGELL